MLCASCGTDNRSGRKFCAACGAPLAVSCPACGSANEPGERFCGECGTALAQETPVAPPEPAAERRLVSILFADLVGSTPAAEGQDPEDVRELLSSYFDVARRVVERFGGTVEKFIGDAVMAVWGAPTALEDDAERAVRAALDLVDAVTALGLETGTGLRARSAVLTGEAAVTIGAEGQGMVAGDLVNTASRVQGIAEPGAVLVGDSTRRASQAAIAYEDAGSHSLRGKSDAVQVWRALRVVAARGGEGRSAGLEAPFVGRGRELRLVKDLFHATADEGKSRLVSIVGVAGVGKSRLSWEFEKYIDGLTQDVWWHRGRCLPYGEGVAYWALAEMVRMRMRILEEEEPESAREKLRLGLAEFVDDAVEREWLEPRLAHLLGLGDRTASDREDLFSAWRLFFERLAETNPTVLLLEDIQWADRALVDFVEYLLEWSRSHPLYVITLARPEVTERHPGWGAGKRNFISLSLEPLPDEAVDELLRGLVPGLPAELRARIGERAEGIPLYAVETVRMLLDRGVLERAGDEYRPVGAIDALEVPETLHALIAARLDAVSPEERRVLADAAVLGKTFTIEALLALGADEATVEQALAALVRKEILTANADPLSPQRGQYGFLQALVQKVAHDTLSRHERKLRHLAAAKYYETAWGSDEEELPEVVASHLLDAYSADPGADDAPEIKTRALEQLERAGERADSLAAPAEALRYFDQAAELADEPLVCARLLERAGVAAQAAADLPAAVERHTRAGELYADHDHSQDAARVTARLGVALWLSGELEAALERLERAYPVLAGDEPDADLASLCAELGRLYFFKGNLDASLEWTERALAIGEALWLPDVLAEALNTKHLVLGDRGRHEEGMALLRHSLTLARDNDVPQSIFRSSFNLSYELHGVDRYAEGLAVDEEGVELARRRGDRYWEAQFLQHVSSQYYALGRWDEALATVDELEQAAPGTPIAELARTRIPAPLIALYRGEKPPLSADELLAVQAPADLQDRASLNLAQAIALLVEERPAEALEPARSAFGLAFQHSFSKQAFPLALEAAFAVGDLGEVDALLAVIRDAAPGETPPFLRAQVARFEGRLATQTDDPGRAAASYRAAEAIFREIRAGFWLGATLVEHAEVADADEAAELADDARPLLEMAGARPWLGRLQRLAAPAAPAAL